MKVKLPDQPSDPKLLEAMEKIKAILNEYDIAAAVLLESKTHGEWLNHIATSWSVARMGRDERGEFMHVKALAKDYPSKEAHKKALEDTIGMLLGFKHGADRLSRNMDAVLEPLAKQFHIEHISKFNK